MKGLGESVRYETPGHTQDYNGKVIIVGGLYLDSRSSQTCRVDFASPDKLRIACEDGGCIKKDSRPDILMIIDALILQGDDTASTISQNYKKRARFIDETISSSSHKKVLEAIVRVWG